MKKDRGFVELTRGNSFDSLIVVPTAAEIEKEKKISCKKCNFISKKTRKKMKSQMNQHLFYVILQLEI